MKEHFPSYLEKHIIQYDSTIKELIKERLKQLREQTKWNILVLFWLGILDLPRFCEFILEDEAKKEQIRTIDRQIQAIENKIAIINNKLDEIDNRYYDHNSMLNKIHRIMNG